MPVYDRVKFTPSGAPGTGSITVGSAVSGFQTPAGAGIPDGTTGIPYAIEDGTAWETGTGTYTVSGTTFSRTLSASSTGSLLSLSSSATIFVTPIASAIGFAPATSSAAGVMSAADKTKLDNITYVVLGADVSNSTVTPANVGMAFTPASNSIYIVEVYLIGSTPTATVGVQIGLAMAATVVTSLSTVRAMAYNTATLGIERWGQLTAGSSIIALGLNTVAGVGVPAYINALIKTGASSTGDINVVFNTETALTAATIYAGSTMRITKVA